MSIKPISSYSSYQTTTLPQLPQLPQWSARQVEISHLNFNNYTPASYLSPISSNLSFSSQFSPITPTFQAPIQHFPSTFSSLAPARSLQSFTFPSTSSSLPLSSALHRSFSPPVHEVSFDREYTQNLSPISWHNPPLSTLNLRSPDYINSSTGTIFRKSIDLLNKSFELDAYTPPTRPLFSAEDRFLHSQLQAYSFSRMQQTNSSQNFTQTNSTPNTQYISPQERVQVLDDNGNVESYPLLDAASTSIQPLSNPYSASTEFNNYADHLMQNPQTGATYLNLSGMNTGFSGKGQIIQNIMMNLSEANAGYGMNPLGQNTHLYESRYDSSIVPSEENLLPPIALKPCYGMIEPAYLPIDLGRFAFSLARGAYKVGISALFKAQPGATKSLVSNYTKSNLKFGQQVQNKTYGNINNSSGTVALRSKLSGLQKAQNSAAQTCNLPDGRIRYYSLEVPASKQGLTRGTSYVTEWNPNTGKVRSWMESYDHFGQVKRVHPKMINGQTVDSIHYPPIGSEIGIK